MSLSCNNLNSGAIISDMVIYSSTRSAGTGDGGFTSGSWQTRTLNTRDVSIQSGSEWASTLSSNQFTLQPGTYYINASLPAYRVATNVGRLYNVTDSIAVLYGTTEYCYNAANRVTVYSRILGTLSITSAKTYRLEHMAQVTKTFDGFGPGAVTFTGLSNNIFTQVKIIRLDGANVTNKVYKPIFAITGAINGSASATSYYGYGNGLSVSGNGIIIPIDCYLTALTCTIGASSTCTITIYNDLVSVGTLGVTSSTSNYGYFNISYSAGDEFHMAVTSGTANTYSTITAWFSTDILNSSKFLIRGGRASSATSFVSYGNGDIDINNGIVIPFDCIATNLTTGSVSTSTYTMSLYKNTSTTGDSVSVSSGTSAIADISEYISAGDNIHMGVTSGTATNGIGGTIMCTSAGNNFKPYTIVLVGERSVSASATTYYSWGAGISNSADGIRLPFGCRLYHMGIKCITSSTYTVTIYKNGSTTGQTVSMSAGTSNDGAVDVQFETGSRVNVAVTSGTATTGSTISLWLTTNI